VLKYATWLKQRHSINSRQIVAMDFTNKPDFIWIWFGLWALGAIPAFINYNLEGAQLVHCVKVSTAELFLVDEEVAHVLDNVDTRTAIEEADGERKKCSIVVFDANTAAVVATWRGERPPDEMRSRALLSDCAILIYTSGTTGMPKPAIVSFQKILLSADFVPRWMGMTSADRFYSSMPLYHSSASVLGVNTVLNAGATMILGHKFSISRTLAELRESRTTIFQYVGETCRYLLTAPPSLEDKNHSVRIAFGNGLRPDVWRAFKSRFCIDTIAEFYATTEGNLASWHLQKGEYGIGAIGRNGILTSAFLGKDVKIIKLDYDTEAPLRDSKTNFCVQVQPNEPGELIWRLDPNNTKAQYQGYFGNESASNEKILRNVFVKGDAWFRTGDLQRRNSDGLWYFMDRLGDTFRWKSENVATADVAAVVGTNPSVEEAAVYGVCLPGHEGKAGCAAIVLKDGHCAQQFAASFEQTVKGLPRYARPVFVRIVKSLEKTGNNKIIKRALQEAGVDLGPNSQLRDVWWCPRPSHGYIPFEKKDWNSLGAGNVKL
jgi:acyl-CoA synthetase (AMP-forming)/AMP-acid ligase II